MKEIVFDAFPEMEGERIDKCISGFADELSRSYIQKIIKEGSVFVNNVPVKANYRVKADDNVRFVIPDSAEPDIPAQDIPLDILYEDSDILIINKPKGMVVHPAAGHYEGTVVNAVMYHCKGELSGINGVMRPGIVHRIDKDTTGSLIICKNDEAHNKVAEQLKNHDIIKRAVRPDGQRAVTHYRVLERFDRYTYVECELETGRTHQIRVHMASIGHPLLGDTVYSSRKSPYKLEGQALHAMTIGLNHPRSGEYIEVDAPLPEYFEELLKKLRLGV